MILKLIFIGFSVMYYLFSKGNGGIVIFKFFKENECFILVKNFI